MYLSFPAGGAPSEFQFGRVVTKLRTRLSDVMVEMCLLIHHHVKSADYEFDALLADMEELSAKLEVHEQEEAEEHSSSSSSDLSIVVAEEMGVNE